MAYEYKELVDKMEEFENIYKKENETRVFWEKWESGDGEIDDWDSLVDRNKSVMKDIEELISKLKDALRKKREIRIEMKHYENGIRYINVRNYNDRKTAYENEWKRIYKDALITIGWGGWWAPSKLYLNKGTDWLPLSNGYYFSMLKKQT